MIALHVNPETGLARADVDARRKEHGFNEVTEKKRRPALKFLEKFWGVSAWMPELIMILSVVLRKYSNLAVVGALLVVNAVVGFMQERRAAGVVETLRRPLQVAARVLREATWQIIPARELVPGDIVRVRSGDIIPANVKLLTARANSSALPSRAHCCNGRIGCSSTKPPRRWTRRAKAGFIACSGSGSRIRRSSALAIARRWRGITIGILN